MGSNDNAAWEILEKREDADGNPIGSRIEVEQASVLENPYIGEEDKARLKRQFEGGGREEQALHGGFAAATGLVYSDFSRDTHVISADEARERVTDANQWRIYGYDAGWNDPRVLIEVGKTPYDQLVVLDEYVESGAHVGDAIEWLEANDKPRGTIFAEHEPGDIEKFERANWPTVKADKSLDAGISEVRKRLESDGNMDLPETSDAAEFADTSGGSGTATWGTGASNAPNSRSRPPAPARSVTVTFPDDSGTSDTGEQLATQRNDRDLRAGLLVSDRCEHLIREFLGYKEEEVGTSAATDHCLDSLRYCIATSANAG